MTSRMISKRMALASLVALALSLVPIATAQAQSYPDKPIRLIVPFAPGGPTDTIARIMGERMKLSLGQPVIIENVGGAGGSIGVGRAVRASPDGYTVSIGNSSSHVFNGAIYALPYDLLQDFEPVVLLSSQPLLIVARGTMPAKNLSEFIAWLKANPDVAAQGTPGAGTAAHVMGVFLQRETGAHFQFVPYRGTGPAVQDLIANQIDFMIDTPTNSLPHVRAHAIKAYAVTAPTRLASAPDIPTVDEAGLPGFHFSFWQAFWVPKGTPGDIVAKLNAAVIDTLADPTVRQRFADQGQEIPAREQQTPQALAAFHKAEIEKWWPIVKAANIKGE
jgi:tripartite-type tricarboxylate transporter receptor subunit TctC